MTTDPEPVVIQETRTATFLKPSSNQYAGRNFQHAGVVVKMVWLRKDPTERACCNWNPGWKPAHLLLECENNRKRLGNYGWAWTA